MIRSIEKYPRLAIVLALTVMLGLAFPSLEVSIMEARDFITAREMVSDGNWLLTTMNGDARYEKPPLPTWFSAVSSMIFGVNNTFAMRLPGLIMAIILGLAFFELMKELGLERRHSIDGTFVLITSFYVLAIIFEAPWDIYTHGFAVLSILFYVKLFRNRGTWKNAMLAGIFLGFSILSKGPIGVFALWLPFLLAYLVIFRSISFRKLWFPIVTSIVIALITGGWWFIYVRLADPETFIAITSRETSNWSSYNVRPFYYYWNFFVQSGIWTIPALVALIYPYLKNRVSDIKAYRFALLWTVFAVILLSLIPEKKARYLMPVLIPLAMNTSFYIDYLFREFRSMTDKRELAPVIFNFSLVALIGLSAGIIGFIAFKPAADQHPVLFTAASLALLAAGVSIFIRLRKKDFPVIFYSAIFIYVVLFGFGTYFSSALKAPSYTPVSELQAELNAKGIALYGPEGLAPEIIWQYGEKIPEVISEDGTYGLPEAREFALLLNNTDLANDEALRKEYTITKGDMFDLNTADTTSHRYKERLRVQLYYLNRPD